MQENAETPTPVSYEHLQSALQRAGAPAGAAESHGAICGVICTGIEHDSLWISHLLGEPDGKAPDLDCVALLHSLAARSRRQLAVFDMQFGPLLPFDDAPLPERVDALGRWCQGLLFGLSLGRTREALERLEGEAAEVLRDVTEIARAGLESSGTGEADEQAYAELVEYLRVAVQILYEELNRDGPASPDPQQPVTLH